MFRVLKAMTAPLPISPSRFSLGTRQSLRMMGVVDDPRMPIFFSSAPDWKPGELRSTMKAENFSPSTLAKMMYTSAKPPLVIHIFSPLRIHSLPSAESTALVRGFIASEAEVDSDSAYAATHSPEASLGRYFFFWSGVP